MRMSMLCGSLLQGAELILNIIKQKSEKNPLRFLLDHDSFPGIQSAVFSHVASNWHF